MAGNKGTLASRNEKTERQELVCAAKVYQMVEEVTDQGRSFVDIIRKDCIDVGESASVAALRKGTGRTRYHISLTKTNKCQCRLHASSEMITGFH